MKEHGMKAFKKDLISSYKDSEFQKTCSEFLKDLENNFLDFNEKYKKFAGVHERYANHKDYNFVHEKLTVKSPLTLIDAAWGSGKTYFIEKFTEKFIDGNLKSDVFKGILIIDAWKYSGSINPSLEFAFEISDKVAELMYGSKRTVNKKVLKKIANNLADSITPNSYSVNLGLGSVNFGNSKTSKMNLNKKEIEDSNRLWKSLKKNKKPIIIFIDNLERLGKDSWVLLRTILKLQEIPNLMIVLPLNLNMLSGNENNNGGTYSEYPIEKYVSFNYYALKQDYTSYLSTIFDDKSLIENLNLIFNSPIQGRVLTIREVENYFNKLKFNNRSDSYKVYKSVYENVWDSSESFNSWFQNEARKVLNCKTAEKDSWFKICDQLTEHSTYKIGNTINDNDWLATKGAEQGLFVYNRYRYYWTHGAFSINVKYSNYFEDINDMVSGKIATCEVLLEEYTRQKNDAASSLEKLKKDAEIISENKLKSSEKLKIEEAKPVGEFDDKRINELKSLIEINNNKLIQIEANERTLESKVADYSLKCNNCDSECSEIKNQFSIIMEQEKIYLSNEKELAKLFSNDELRDLISAIENQLYSFNDRFNRGETIALEDLDFSKVIKDN